MDGADRSYLYCIILLSSLLQGIGFFWGLRQLLLVWDPASGHGLDSSITGEKEVSWKIQSIVVNFCRIVQIQMKQ